MKLKRKRSRKVRQKARSLPPLASIPFRTFQNPYTSLEVFTGPQLETIHRASIQILEEVGIEFLDQETLSIWQSAGALVDWDQQRVRIEGQMVEEAMKTVPSSFSLQARNPEKSLTIGGNQINFATVGSAPYYSDIKVGRQPGSLAPLAGLRPNSHHRIHAAGTAGYPDPTAAPGESLCPLHAER